MIVNVDYIGVVKQNGNTFKYEEVPITHSHQDTLSQLKAMVNDDSMTACEMYTLFLSAFLGPVDLNYCYPNNYDDYNYGPSSGVFPTFFDRSVYNQVLDKKIYELHEDNVHAENGNNSDIEEGLIITRKNWITRAKYDYLSRCEDYIKAYDYYSLQEKLNSDKSIKMYSTEVIGEYSPQSTMSFKLTNDIAFSLHTNFRYGNSACFFLKMHYKGVQLLFYSHYVKYYYAIAAEVVRYTVQYYPRRENWSKALELIARYSNEANMNPERFEYEFIDNEIVQLIDGLRRIMGDQLFVQKYIEDLTTYVHESEYIGLRAISNSEIGEYKVHKIEMELMFKTEKITGALELLNSMKDFTSISPKVNDAIVEIQDMNRKLAPQIIEKIKELEAEIREMDIKIDSLSKEYERLGALLKPYYDERAVLIQSVDITKSPDLSNKYEEEHPVFVMLKNDCEKVFIEVFTLKKEQNYRISFRARMQRCLDNIKNSGLMVA